VSGLVRSGGSDTAVSRPAWLLGISVNGEVDAAGGVDDGEGMAECRSDSMDRFLSYAEVGLRAKGFGRELENGIEMAAAPELEVSSTNGTGTKSSFSSVSFSSFESSASSLCIEITLLPFVMAR
jgi:hypothetical protein